MNDTEKLVREKTVERYHEILCDALRHPSLQSATPEAAAIIASPEFAEAFYEALQARLAADLGQPVIDVDENLGSPF